ncbi:MAG TPA: aromatic ring-hydroxylating dioxygenase subunit alpha [Thermohalobaculum sp.]|nr:aromatic ring-hydroxylating dioxygenase subunit alpha [Thermohalobaculum sp.]
MQFNPELNDVPKQWDRRGLPGWTYTSRKLAEIEDEIVFRRHWQLVCHTGDVPEPGNYQTYDVAGERALIVRGKDGEVRAFHNLCRHRGSRVVPCERGELKSVIICPFHGWTYDLEGRLRGVAQPRSLPPLDPDEWGLKPLEMEIWQGFVFVRFKPGPQPAVAEIMARHAAELAPYGLSDIISARHVAWYDDTPVNWKAVRDVDNEGYHVAMAHPGLHELYGRYYYDESFRYWTSRSFASFNPGQDRLWSVRAYKSILPDAPWLPESHRRAWLYIGLFPNQVIGLYPDSVMFYQEVPVGPGRARLRGANYRRPDESRGMRAARYLSGRIDAITAEEDKQLTIWSCEATRSSAYDGVMLSDLEYGVRSFHDILRTLIPVYSLDEEPEAEELERVHADVVAAYGG